VVLMPKKVLLHPFVTEKTMNQMTGSPALDYKDGNKLEFIVMRTATKADIKAAFEEQFQCKVEKVWTKTARDGKHAVVKLAEGYSAEDIGMRIGVF
jgi:large subunit ribosomal protein L23